jgi:predicted RNase H-like nuclease (RuvC/YqgF family)
MPTQQDFDALVTRLDALVTRLEALEVENAALLTEISEERVAREALEEQLHQFRYEKGLRIAL